MNIRKIFLHVLVIIMIFSMSGCTNEKVDETTTNETESKKKIEVAVSIVPQETFVKAVGGDLVNVVTMIPPGHSPANYQPTPKQMTKLSDSKIYFSIGVSTEEANILPKIESLNKEIKVVSLKDKVGEIYPHRQFRAEEIHSHHHDDEEHDEHDHDEEHGHEEHEHHEEEHRHPKKDPHIWLSPKRVKVMIDVIKDELITLDPDHKDIYEKNAEEYIGKLDEVDHEIKDIFNGLEKQSFVIYHPAFGYFADDYGLKMVTIEEEGKEATVKRLQEVIDFAKAENIKFVFYQKEFDSQQAETISKEIGGTTVQVSPLDSNYIKNLKSIANKFREVLK